MWTPAFPDAEQLTLYQKTARAALVVRARSLTSATRRPQVTVLEVLKGSYDADTLTIVPTWVNNTRPIPGVEREVFRVGEESILFLVHYVDEYGRPGGAGVFSVLTTASGKIEVPIEGADALVTAVRRFRGILDLPDHDAQMEQMRKMLREPNPFLIEAALTECLRFRAITEEDTEALLPLLVNPRPGFRSGALDLLAMLVREAREAGPVAGILSDREVFDRVGSTALNDTDPSVRSRAIVALETFGTPTALSLIDTIGAQDASQSVRYQAQVAAHRLRTSANRAR